MKVYKNITLNTTLNIVFLNIWKFSKYFFNYIKVNVYIFTIFYFYIFLHM